MNDNDIDLERLILKTYVDLLKKDSIVPSVQNIVRDAKITCEKEAYDLIYGEDFVNKISEQSVHNILSAYKHAHRYFGTTCYEAQMLLFDDWYDFQILLKE